MNLGLGKPHHASMNTGALISNGMVYTGYGAQNNPSGGIIAYKINVKPASVELLKKLQRRISRMAISSSLKRVLSNWVLKANRQVNKKRYSIAVKLLNSLSKAVAYSYQLSNKQKRILSTRTNQVVDLLQDD